MELNGTKTKDLLEKALDAELRTGFRYRMIAEAARKKGMSHVADIFEAIARNELEHAGHEFDFLGGIGDIKEVIARAIEGEATEATRIYPEAAAVAEKEGFTDIASFFRRIGTVEARHEEHFRAILGQTEQGQEPEGRTVGNSMVEMARVMQPEQANSAGFIHGGELMKIMDDAAAVVAARHSGTSVVTGSVEDIKFLRPVRIGDLLIVQGRITFTSHTSMEVLVEVDAEGIFSENSRRRTPVLSALFVMVAVDPSGKAVPAPPLIYSTEEEEKLFEEGRARYEARKAAKR
jgi:acyl-CoA hydrolase/bacterioferritin (cytochrome b1)